MGNLRQTSRISTLDLKAQISKKLGREKADKYFLCVKKFLGYKLTKLEFDKFCYSAMGKENIGLHNLFIRSILKNACLAHGPPANQANTGNSGISKITNGYVSETFPASPRKENSVNSHYRKDRPSPLGPYGKVHTGGVQDVSNSCDLRRHPELISIGSKALMGSVEDGEEVEQAKDSPCVQSRSPIRAPIGISWGNSGVSQNHLHHGPRLGFYPSLPKNLDTCCSSSELPDTISLKKRLEGKLEKEGLLMTAECANLLNIGLDAYLKRLIKPCIELARSRCSTVTLSQVNQRTTSGINRTLQCQSNQSSSASLLDFQAAMELNPQLLGQHWPVELEKICFRALE